MRRTGGIVAVCRVLCLVTAGMLAGSASLGAQIMFPVDSVEHWLLTADFGVGPQVGSRFPEDRTQRTVIHLSSERSLMVKWAEAPRGGEEFNNVPRYEVAAYELQKLFLDQSDYVVPPTVLRAFPLSWYRKNVDPEARATFGEAESVLAVIQYWLFDVEAHPRGDMDRFETDDAYARRLADCNVLTYLIEHKDENQGNFLMARNPDDPRIFSVDNGIAFDSRVSDRGYWWRTLQVDRLPRTTVERLRDIDRGDLDRTLGVLYQYEIQDRELVPVAPGAPLSWRGIEEEDGVVQLGLTRQESDDVEDRIENILEEVDEGEVELF